MGVRLEVVEGVAEVVLDRPEVLNALDTAAKRTLGDIWQSIATDPTVHAAVVFGAGRSFCAGSDLKEMARTGKTVDTDTLLRALPGVTHPLDKPVVAALHGHVLGMGLSLAMHCDLRIAAPDVTLGLPEAPLGMISAASAITLPRIIPTGVALQMLLLGDTLDADDALGHGLVNRIAPDPVAEARAWAKRLAEAPAVAITATKRLATIALREGLATWRLEIDEARRRVELDLESSRDRRP